MNRHASPVHLTFTILSLAVILGSAPLAHARVAHGTRPGDTHDHGTLVEYNGWNRNFTSATHAVRTGRGLIQHLQAADALLATQTLPQAEEQLTISGEDVAALRASMPFLLATRPAATPTGRMHHKPVQYRATLVEDDLLPVYAGGEQLRIYRPLGRPLGPPFGGHTAAGPHDKPATRASRTANPPRLHEIAADEIDSTVYLPIDIVAQDIRHARKDLAQTHPAVRRADRALTAALGSLVSLSDQSRLAPTG